MNFMFDDKLKEAYEKSDLILDSLKNYRNDVMSTQRIVRAVEEAIGCKIIISTCSFSEVSEDIRKYGAMMRTQVKEDGCNLASIVLNSDNNAKFQRFSLVHELGHLMTGNLFDNSNEKYIVSTHINYELTSIPPEDYKENDFLLGEQLANVFALRVLMPKELFYKMVDKMDSFSEIADLFGLERNAVLSRIMLVE